MDNDGAQEDGSAAWREGLRNRFRREQQQQQQRVTEPEPVEAVPERASPPAAAESATPAASTEQPAAEEANAFECNICFSSPRDPIVTTCGHVHCWQCIYKWMETFRDKTTPCVCPVCKNVIDTSKCIPVYGRGGSNRDPRETIPEDPNAAEIPQRPGPGPREEAPQRPNHPFGFPLHGGAWGVNLSAGFMPGLAFTFGGGPVPIVADNNLTPEQRRTQHFLSQIALFIGMAILLSLLMY